MKTYNEILYFTKGDIEEISQLEGTNGGSLLTELVGIYAEISPAILSKIESAFEAKNAQEISANAHSLKSSSANLGLTQMRDRCAYLEKNSETIIGHSESDAILELRQCYETSLGQIKDYVSGLSNKVEIPG